MTVSSSASWSRFSPPSDLVNGHMSTMWFIICHWPRSQEGDWARPRLCKLARHGLDLSGNGPSKTTCDEGDGKLAVGSQARSQRSLCSFWTSLSVCVPFARRTPLRAAGLLLWARRAGDRHRSIAAWSALSSSGAAARRSAANAGSATLSADVGS